MHVLIYFVDLSKILIDLFLHWKTLLSYATLSKLIIVKWYTREQLTLISLMGVIYSRGLMTIGPYEERIVMME